MIICVFCVSILKRTLTYFSKLNDEGRYITNNHDNVFCYCRVMRVAFLS